MSVQANPLVTSPVKVIHDYSRRSKITAEYFLEAESGPAHRKSFTMKLRLGDKEYIGTDRSIKLAQRAAAEAALDNQPSLLTNNGEKEKSTKQPNYQPATVWLNTWAAKNHIPTKYIFLHGQISPSIDPQHRPFPYQTFYYRLIIGEEIVFDGFGSSHSQARLNCASQALSFIQHNPSCIETLFNKNVPQPINKSPITLMYERAKNLRLSVTIECQDSTSVTYKIGEQYSAVGTGINKQEAKRNAAEKMLAILPIADEIKTEKTTHRRHTQHKKFIQQKISPLYFVSDDINPITRLYQISQARNIPIKFEGFDKSTTDNLFRFEVQYGDDLNAEGFGQSKQTAKRAAAENLLLKLNPFGSKASSIKNSVSPTVPSKSLLKREENSGKTVEKKHVHFREDESEKIELKTSRSCGISIKEQLIKACEKLNIQVQYQEESITNHPNEYQSILSLATGDRLLAKFRGQGPSIERAQENVSNAAWKNLRQLFNGSIPTPKSNDKTKYQRVKLEVSPTEMKNEDD